jgi:signal transduction histidine kinase
VEQRTAELAQANASLKAEIAERRRAEHALKATVIEKEQLFQAEARLFDQIHRRAQDLEALQAISSGLRQAGTREAMLQFIMEKSVEALSGDAGALLQVEGSMLVLRAEYGKITGLLGRPHSPADCMHWRSVHTGEAVYITDESGELGTSCQCEICGILMRDIASSVVIPLKTAEATVGLLHLVFASRREFSEEKKHMLATIAEITGSALHRAGILETLEQRVADRTRELAALYEVTAVSSEALDLQTILERSLERVLKAMRSSTATIHLLDEKSGNLSLAAYQTDAPAGPTEIDLTTPVPYLQEWLIVRGEALVIPDMTASSHIPWATDLSWACTYAGAPMRAGGRRLGMLGVLREAEQQFSVEEVALLASIADQIAVAVENARLHQHAEQMAILEERARLARELHDSVTQCLSSVTLLAQAGSDFSEAGEWGRVRHYLERIRDNGGQALKEMRLLLYELQPPSTEQESLVEMLTHRLEAVEERAGVNVRLVADDWLRLPAPAEEALYRIAQEALNNALKHSGASTVTIELHGRPDAATLEVSDNGAGFDPESVRRKGGIGLISIQQRAEKLGGELAIRSAPCEGTSIKVSLSGGSIVRGT